MTRSPDVVAYLRARLDEDHVAAVQYGKDIDRWWRETALHREQGRICSCQGCITLSAAPPDPDRMLAEVAAKRAVLGLHRLQIIEGRNADGDEREGIGCETCIIDDGYPCPTVLAMAQPYAGRDDFARAWRLQPHL